MSDEDLHQLLTERYQRVEESIAQACRQSGRRREEVTLVSVTKTISTRLAGLLPNLGFHDLGESRPQELWRKASLLPQVRWHLIGHLQRNKIERTLPLVHLIHSVDSLRLLEAIEREAAKNACPVDLLLEVNASQEPNKHGFAPEELEAHVEGIAAARGVRLRGLMTMAAYDEDPERCRSTFRALRELRERLRPQFPAPHDFHHLSMGMTNDFAVAIEEGATIVRIGTALFEDLEGEDR